MIRAFWLGLLIFIVGLASTARSVRYLYWSVQDKNSDAAFGEFIIIVLSLAVVVIGICLMIPFVVTELDL